jgi:NADPH:quinone reductase-like Zn-dependent oxidoreductase
VREVVISRFGPPSVLRMRERADPEPAAGQIRVRVAAAGINFADIYYRMGLSPDVPPLPAVPGFEVAGTVDAIGPGVMTFAIGDRVIAITKFGGYTDALVIPAARVFRLPAGMSMEEGAALPVAYLTAYHAICVLGNIRAGQRVLIHSAAGAVGIAAIQVAKMIGAETFGTAGRAKLDEVRRLGVDHAIASDDDFEEEVRQLTRGRGVHLVLDPLGSRSWKAGYRLLAPTGRLCILGSTELMRHHQRRWLPSVLFALLSTPLWPPLRLMSRAR